MSYTYENKNKKVRSISTKKIKRLNIDLAQYILPRLKLFRKTTHGYPPNMTWEQWEETLDKIILAFSYILQGKSENEKEISEGLRLFTENLDSLWL